MTVRERSWSFAVTTAPVGPAGSGPAGAPAQRSGTTANTPSSSALRPSSRPSRSSSNQSAAPNWRPCAPAQIRQVSSSAPVSMVTTW